MLAMFRMNYRWKLLIQLNQNNFSRGVAYKTANRSTGATKDTGISASSVQSPSSFRKVKFESFDESSNTPPNPNSSRPTNSDTAVTLPVEDALFPSTNSVINDTQLFPPFSKLSTEEYSDPMCTSFIGIGARAFGEPVLRALSVPVDPSNVEIKPDGIIYLPEIKYRRILNSALGPGAWGLLPRGPHSYEERSRTLSREYALFCLGRFVSCARGEQEFFEGNSSLATATEAVKSNALMRCCKDLGIASELWDPNFIVSWKKQYAEATFPINVKTKEKKRIWKRKDRELEYPWKEE